jgi:hypothetical protein
MNKNTREKMIEYYNLMSDYGISYKDANTLRRCEMTLRRWYELECGNGNDYASWAIERDETTNRPYVATYPHAGKSYRRLIADRESGAIKRATKIAADFSATIRVQGDPRGGALYLITKDGREIYCNY